MSIPRNDSVYDYARGTAFKETSGPGPTGERVETRVRLKTLMLLASLPGTLGGTGLAAAFSRGGAVDGAFPLAFAALMAAGCLIVLGLRSRLFVDSERLTVKFFGLRETTILFDDAVAATFGMSFPSISFGVKLKDRRGRRAIVHANWWRDEEQVMAIVCRRLLELDIAMDRQTALTVSRTLHVPRPDARILHRPRLRKDRTF